MVSSAIRASALVLFLLAVPQGRSQAGHTVGELEHAVEELGPVVEEHAPQIQHLAIEAEDSVGEVKSLLVRSAVAAGIRLEVSAMNALRPSSLKGLPGVVESLDRQGMYEEAARGRDDLAIYEKSVGEDSASLASELSERAALAKTGAARRSAVIGEDLDNVIGYVSRGDATVLRDLEMVDRRVGSLSIVQADVKRFIQEFGIGASDPDRYLKNSLLVSPELTELWLRTPLEKRIFIIGAGEDDRAIELYKRSLADSGFMALFYRDCHDPHGGLCDSRVIGAFFRTASRALMVESTAAERSLYVPLEVAKAHQLRGQTGLMLLVSPEAIIESARSGVASVSVIAVGVAAVADYSLERDDWGLAPGTLITGASGSGLTLVALGFRLQRRRARANRAAAREISGSSLMSAELHPLTPLASLALTWFGTIVITMGIAAWHYGGDGWFLVPAGAPLVLVTIVAALPRSSCVRLSPGGFSTSVCYLPWHNVTWADGGQFYTRKIHFRTVVFYEPKLQPAGTRRGRTLQRLFSGRLMLPRVCGLDASRLLELMKMKQAAAQVNS